MIGLWKVGNNMSIQQMREWLSYHCTYKGTRWVQKVAKMSDAQVIAVYHRLVNIKK